MQGRLSNTKMASVMAAIIMLLIKHELTAEANTKNIMHNEASIYKPSIETQYISECRNKGIWNKVYQHPWGVLQQFHNYHVAIFNRWNSSCKPMWNAEYTILKGAGDPLNHNIGPVAGVAVDRLISSKYSKGWSQDACQQTRTPRGHAGCGRTDSSLPEDDGSHRQRCPHFCPVPIHHMWPSGDRTPPSACGFPALFAAPAPEDRTRQWDAEWPARCETDNYRSLDGFCNNLRHPTWGMISTTFRRALPARYADGLQLPTRAVSGEELPSARLVSLELFPEGCAQDSRLTLAAMQYGQVITHDMAFTLGTAQARALMPECCLPDRTAPRPAEWRDARCYPIEVDPEDPVYSRAGQRCLSFARSASDVSLGPAEQIVASTHYLDASLVYGSTAELASSLREFQGGRLRTVVKHGRPFPPAAPNKTAVCDNVTPDEACYLTGDSRMNQNPQLTILQIILLREHNRVSSHLQQLNPHWDDERLYQESRRIVIAEHQHISYYEWLPLILGEHHAKVHGLTHEGYGFTHDYQESVDPSILNGHSTAAFRYFHTNIAGYMCLFSEGLNVDGALRLSDHINRPGVIEKGHHFDHLIRGMATQPQAESDQVMDPEAKHYMFRYGGMLGNDLKALDIQRGRDHGLASYNDYRQYCGLPRARQFEDFRDYISPENVQRLEALYEHPDDVDYVVGGSLETHVNGAMVGPSFLCVITEQFYRTRVGDRYFYENGDHPHPFTHAQLAEIRRASFSRLLCDNSNEVLELQPRGFQKVSPYNPVVPCSRTDAIPSVDLESWREARYN